MVEVELATVEIDEATKIPFVELRSKTTPSRVLPISIGVAEAGAIKMAVEGRTTPRPLTHDLFHDSLLACGVTIDLIVVTEFRERVFYAELHLNASGERRTVSARPSDAIALAVRAGCPIFVADVVMEEHGVDEAAEDDAVDGDELVDEFRKFIDDINPEDFASGT